MIVEILTTAALAGVFYLLLRRSQVLLPKSETRQRKEPAVEPVLSLDQLFREGEDFLRQGKFSEAEGKFLEVKLHNPRYPKIDNRLGIVYTEKGEYARAVESFEQAVRENPMKAARHANLGVAYVHLKKIGLAKHSLERAIELSPANERYKQLLKELAEVKE